MKAKTNPREVFTHWGCVTLGQQKRWANAEDGSRKNNLRLRNSLSKVQRERISNNIHAAWEDKTVIEHRVPQNVKGRNATKRHRRQLAKKASKASNNPEPSSSSSKNLELQGEKEAEDESEED